MSKDKEKGMLFFITDKGIKPIAPINKDANIGDILAMKEMFEDKNDKPNAIMIDDEVKWMK